MVILLLNALLLYKMPMLISHPYCRSASYVLNTSSKYEGGLSSYSHCLMISVHAVHHLVLPCDFILSCDPDQHVISFNKICVHKSQKSTCSTPSSSLFSLLLWYLICLFRFGTACTGLKMRWNGLLLTVLYQLFYSKGHAYTLSGLWLLVNRTVLGVCQ